MVKYLKIRNFRGIDSVDFKNLARVNLIVGGNNTGNSTLGKRLSILSTAQPDPLVTSELFNQIAPLNPENETKLEELLRDSMKSRMDCTTGDWKSTGGVFSLY